MYTYVACMHHIGSFRMGSLKISCKSVHPFSRNLANKETNKERKIHTNKEIDRKQYPVIRSIGGRGNYRIISHFIGHVCTQCECIRLGLYIVHRSGVALSYWLLNNDKFPITLKTTDKFACGSVSHAILAMVTSESMLIWDTLFLLV